MTVRVGVIGAGGWTKTCHIPGIQAHPEAEVVALCSRNHERCQAQADEFSIPQVYTDYRDLITNAGIDAVTISTPNVSHAPVALAALEAGKHVFCEKPLAMNGAQAQQMYEAARRAGVQNHVAFTFRYLYGTQLMKQMVDRGEIGRVYEARATLDSGGALNPQAPLTWRFIKAQAGSGMLGDIGSHLLDQLQWHLGPVRAACGQTAILYDQRPLPEGGTGTQDADDYAEALLDWGDGRHGRMVASRISYGGSESMIELWGTQGALRTLISRGDKDALWLCRPGGTWEPVALPQVPVFNHAIMTMMHTFIDDILSGDTSPMVGTFEDGARAQHVMDAILTSSTGKGWIEV